jgi:hypothetical protein
MSSVDNLVELTREIRQLYLSGTFTDIPSITLYLESNPRYTEICKRYTSMIPIICSNNYDQERLEYMIRLSDRVRRGEIDEKTASVAVGQRLVDEIVKPQINKNKK